MANLDEGVESETFGETSGQLRYQGTEEAGEEQEGGAEEEETSEEGEAPSEEEEEETSEEEEADEEAALEKELFGDEKTPKELEALKKRLLGTYTKKMMGVTALRMKADLVDQIDKNPKEAILALAQQYGVDLPAGKDETAELDFSKMEIPNPEKDEQISSYLKRVLAPLFGGLGKQVVGAVKGAVAKSGKTADLDTAKIKAQEKVQKALGYLNENHPDWGLYEEEMTKVLKEHPTLKDDPERLYTLGKSEYLKGVRMKTGKGVAGKATKVKTGERATKVVQTSVKGKKLTFNEAWERARKDASKVR